MCLAGSRSCRRTRQLQVDLAGAAPELLAIGAPDMRLAVLPARYEALLDELDAGDGGDGSATGDRPRSHEMRRLRQVVPRVAAMCAELAGYGIAETIQHDDLNDGAVYVRDGRYLILDWGDACVSHPFFSMSVTLEGVIGWGPDDVQGSVDLTPFRDAYLAPFAGILPAEAASRRLRARHPAGLGVSRRQRPRRRASTPRPPGPGCACSSTGTPERHVPPRSPGHREAARRVRRAIQVEHELLAVDLVHLDAHLPEPEGADDRQRCDVARGDRGAEAVDPLRLRPGKQRPDALGGDPPAPERRLDAVADLDAPGLVRRVVEPDRPDELAAPVRVGPDDAPAEPRLARGIRLEVGDAVVEEVARASSRRSAGRSASISRRGRVEVARDERAHERERHRNELDALGADRGDDGLAVLHGAGVPAAVLRYLTSASGRPPISTTFRAPSGAQPARS